VRLLGTALVVHLYAAAMMERKPTTSLVQGFCRIGDDFQSGSKQPHSKGCRPLNRMTVFNFNLYGLCLSCTRNERTMI